MFINLGTIIAARNEAELAGVMGHEMAHVYIQHSAKQAGKAQTTSMIAGIASAVLGGTVGGMEGGLVQSVRDAVLLSVPPLGLRQTLPEVDQHQEKS